MTVHTHEILATPLQLASTPPRHRARCTHSRLNL
ncbi:hypothetical protein V483_3385, partial [Bordetella pertussis CHLA-11]